MSDTDVKPVKRKWGKMALILSLALNLLFVGTIVGAGWMRNMHNGELQGPPGFMIKYMLRNLPDEKRKLILEQITNHRLAQAPRIKFIKATRQALIKTLKAEPYNVKKARRIADKLNFWLSELRGARMGLLVDLLNQLTPDERRQVLESPFFRRMIARGDRRWGPHSH